MLARDTVARASAGGVQAVGIILRNTRGLTNSVDAKSQRLLPEERHRQNKPAPFVIQLLNVEEELLCLWLIKRRWAFLKTIQAI